MMLKKLFLVAVAATQCRAAVGAVNIAGLSLETDVSEAIALGDQLEAVNAALSQQTPNFAEALSEYRKNISETMSLRHILTCSPARPLACDSEPFATYASFWGSWGDYITRPQTYLEGPTVLNMGPEARKETAMAGIVLEGFQMAVISHVKAAVEEACSGDFTKGLEFLEYAWALYASSSSVGLISVAEMRGEEFDVLASQAADSGKSQVNVRLLDYFTSMQSRIKEQSSESCAALQELSQQSIALMHVPLIQGLYQQMYIIDTESDDAVRFLEVVKGWASVRTILPAVHNCSADVATTLRLNMQNLHLGPTGPHLSGGFGAVRRRLESVYDCLGVTCEDINAMVESNEGGNSSKSLLWEPCGSTSTTNLVPSASGAPARRPVSAFTELVLVGMLGAYIMIGSRGD